MSFSLEPGKGFIFMKVGVHAREPLEDILQRKRKELQDAGVSFWGYGGNTCHPTTKVQPFVRELREAGQDVYLCMHSMVSNHWAEPVRAEEYSEDGYTWKKVPKEINVLGSRYALVLESLDEANFDLHLNQTKVGIGVQQGRTGVEYIQGRVDKACLTYEGKALPAAVDNRVLDIHVAAKIARPFAVMLR